MKISSFRIRNFRGYRDSGVISFDRLTAFVGKNDAGKSTVLEALDIFFNVKKIDKGDVNVHCRELGDTETSFNVCFTDLPTEVDIDAGGKTNLKDEYLLNANGLLEIEMRFADAGKPKCFVVANHPSSEGCNELLKKKNADLKKIVEKLKIECDLKTNSTMRKSIWAHFGGDLQLEMQMLEVDSKDGEIKAIWEKLQAYLPVFSLFKSDRSNDDKDAEVQDPLKVAVRQVVKEAGLQDKLNEIEGRVKTRLEDVAARTLQKVNEMAPGVANSLHPKMPPLKWEDLFKGISITGDQDIPLSKRGSGVRRLVLLNFFRAEAERLRDEKGAPDVIYAIEEPETSQHANFQMQLVDALVKMSITAGVQIVVTTHSSVVVKMLEARQLRIVFNNESGSTVKAIDEEGRVLPELSLNEICYLAYGKEASVEYHDELYGCLWVKEENSWRMLPHKPNERFHEKDFDLALKAKGVAFTKKWARDDGKGTKDCTLHTYIRNKIHHPENQDPNNTMYTSEELATSISGMRELLRA